MDILFEILMEVLVEGFLGMFVDLLEGFLPQKSITSKVKKTLTVCIAILVMALASGTFIGLCTLVGTGGKSILGWCLVGAGAAYLALGIILKLCRKRHVPGSNAQR